MSNFTSAQKAAQTKEVKFLEERLECLKKYYSPRKPNQSYYLGEFISRYTIVQCEKELAAAKFVRGQMDGLKVEVKMNRESKKLLREMIMLGAKPSKARRIVLQMQRTNEKGGVRG